MVAAATPERVEWKLSVEAKAGPPWRVSAAILQRARDTRAATVRPAGGTPAATVAAFSAGAKCLILVVEVPSVLAVCLLILIAVLAAPGAMILFPFHFPFAVLEFRYGNPGLVRARSWRRIREICIG